MLNTKDYSKMTREELIKEEEKMKSQKMLTAFFIGMLIAIAVWSATHQGLVLPIVLLIVAFVIGKKNGQTIKDIQAEINRRATDT